MIGVKIRSIRVSQVLSLVSVITLVLLAFVHIYFDTVIGVAENRYQRILHLQKKFVDLVAIENVVLSGGEHYANLLVSNLDLVDELAVESQLLHPAFIREREHVFNTLMTTVGENRQFYLDIRNSLPLLVADVRHIHAYHIDGLHSIFSSSNLVLPSDMGDGLKQSPDRSVSELDIIDSAVQVQNYLLDVVAVFYEMQLGDSIDNIEDLFQQRMTQFSEAVSSFDDISLDAQDGLLVEELLLIGKHFREAFGMLLKNNGKINLLQKKLADNQQQISVMFDDAAKTLKFEMHGLQQHLATIRNISIVVLLSLVCWLIAYGVRLSRAFSRTVTEAEKIGNNLSYRIPDWNDSYQEFHTIYRTLNTLAETADGQVKSLEQMQRELGRLVQERTAELVLMNTRLKNEIADRVKADVLRKELEDQLIRAKKMEAVGTLAGGVAHDLNNILSGVVTYPELLLFDMHEDDPLYKPLQNIKKSGECAASIVQDLLILARRGVVVKTVIDFRALVKEYLESAEFWSLKNTHPKVEIDVCLEDFTGNVIGSKVHLQKAVMNIIINGMEAMPEGGRLSIGSRAVYVDTVMKGYDSVQEGDYVCFTVSDTGIGISEEVITHIFEPFFARKNVGESGTGLGMAVVYSTVKDHSGYIDIDSEPGKGSVIALYFPLTRENCLVCEQSTDLLSLAGNSQHLLVVDDIYEQRQIASAMLKRLEYTVATAASGEEAVAYVRDNVVDLVILDMVMPPGMDGFETFMAIKAVDPEMPVIIASGYSEDDRVRRTLNLGAEIYIKKPYSVEMLGKAVHTVLNDA